MFGGTSIAIGDDSTEAGKPGKAGRGTGKAGRGTGKAGKPGKAGRGTGKAGKGGTATGKSTGKPLIMLPIVLPGEPPVEGAGGVGVEAASALSEELGAAELVGSVALSEEEGVPTTSRTAKSGWLSNSDPDWALETAAEWGGSKGQPPWGKRRGQIIGRRMPVTKSVGLSRPTTKFKCEHGQY